MKVSPHHIHYEELVNTSTRDRNTCVNKKCLDNYKIQRKFTPTSNYRALYKCEKCTG